MARNLSVGFCRLCRKPGWIYGRIQVCKSCDSRYQETEIPTREIKECQPTTAAPGTSEKMLVMEMRRANRENLFHLFDARYEGDTLPSVWNTATETERVALIRSKINKEKVKENT